MLFRVVAAKTSTYRDAVFLINEGEHSETPESEMTRPLIQLLLATTIVLNSDLSFTTFSLIILLVRGPLSYVSLCIDTFRLLGRPKEKLRRPKRFVDFNLNLFKHFIEVFLVFDSKFLFPFFLKKNFSFFLHTYDLSHR